MKHVIIAFLVTAFSVSSFAQKIDKIIQKHLKAHGGIEKWDKVENLHIKGKFTAFSIDKSFTSIKTKEGKYYSKHFLGKHEVEEAFDGNKGWTIDPWQELGFPRGLNKTENDVFRQKADFFSPFYKYKEKGYKAELIGKEGIDGTEVYTIKLTRTSGNEETWYLDAKTYLALKCTSTWVDFAFPCKAETYFDNYSKVNGLVIPFYIERTFKQRNRIMQIESVDVNIPIEKSLFKFPKNEEIKKLAFLEGNWEVEVEIFRRGKWRKMDKTKSSIKFAAENMLEEKINYDYYFPHERIIQYGFNADLKEYVITVYDSFGSTIQLFSGALKNDILKLNQKHHPKGVLDIEQFIFSEMKSDGFILEVKSSKDNGETWKEAMRFIYKSL